MDFSKKTSMAKEVPQELFEQESSPKVSILAILLLGIGFMAGVLVSPAFFVPHESTLGQALVVEPALKKVAGAPEDGLPSSVNALFSEMSANPNWIRQDLTKNLLAKKILDEAIQKNAVFFLNEKKLSAAEVQSNKDYYAALVDKLVYAIESDAGGVDRPKVISQISNIPRADEFFASQSYVCEKVSLFVPCVYRQYQSFLDNEQYVLTHVFGGCKEDLIVWSELRQNRFPRNACG